MINSCITVDKQKNFTKLFVDSVTEAKEKGHLSTSQRQTITKLVINLV